MPRVGERAGQMAHAGSTKVVGSGPARVLTLVSRVQILSASPIDPLALSSSGDTVAPCKRSVCSVPAARSSEPRCPRRDASGCTDGAIERRSVETPRFSSPVRDRSTPSGCASRSRPRCSTATSSFGRSARCHQAGSCCPDPASGTSSSAPRAWTYALGTGSGSSRAAEAGRATAILPRAAPGPGAGCGMTGPPSSSGLGFRPFKAATRVRIPLGAHNRIAHTRP